MKRKKEGRRGPVSNVRGTKYKSSCTSYLVDFLSPFYFFLLFDLLLFSTQCSDKPLHDSHPFFLDLSRTLPHASFASRFRTRHTDPFLVRRPKCLRRLSSPRRRLSVSDLFHGCVSIYTSYSSIDCPPANIFSAAGPYVGFLSTDPD